MNQSLRVSLLSLVGCFGISAFLMSSSFAQVNGPGPSPSGDFDTVINLPGDEAIISDGFGEEVGGIPGQTVQLNVSDGGALGAFFDAEAGGEVNISGGNLGNFRANPDSVVNLIGRRFFLDGVELGALQEDQAFTITDRNVLLSGLLADGGQFSLPLNGFPTDVGFFFSADATFNVTLTNPVLVGDVNLDGDVNFLDIAPFIAILSSVTFQAEADVNGSGSVNFIDVFPFIGILSDQ